MKEIKKIILSFILAISLFQSIRAQNKDYEEYRDKLIKKIEMNPFHWNNFFYMYANSYYSRWECEEDTQPGRVGIKHFGNGSRLGSVWFCSESNTDSGDVVVSGPGYKQDRTYRYYFDNDDIFYRVNFNMKTGRDNKEHLPVCSISVRFSFGGKDTILASKTIFTDELGTEYRTHRLEYIIPEKFNGRIYSNPENKVYPNLNKSDSENEGVNFEVTFLGNEELFIDFIEVYDTRYFLDYIYSKRSSIEGLKSYTNYLMEKDPDSFDKYLECLYTPKTIDNIAPCRIVDSLVYDIRKDKTKLKQPEKYEMQFLDEKMMVK